MFLLIKNTRNGIIDKTLDTMESNVICAAMALIEIYHETGRNGISLVKSTILHPNRMGQSSKVPVQYKNDYVVCHGIDNMYVCV